LYDYAWFVGFGVAFFTHWAFSVAIPPVADSGESVASYIFTTLRSQRREKYSSE
jgi:hypothetical protein